MVPVAFSVHRRYPSLTSLVGNHLHMFTKMDHLGNSFGHINYKELANVHGYHAMGIKKIDLLQVRFPLDRSLFQ